MTSSANESRYPDFVIRCVHGGQGDGAVAVKYRWAGAEWMPAPVQGKHNVKVTTLRGNEVDEWWSVAIDDEDGDADGIPLELRRPIDAPPIREQHEIHCSSTHCRNRVPAQKDALQFLFMATTLAVRQAPKSGLRAWIYELAELVTAVDSGRGTITFNFDALRAALGYSKMRFGRHAAD